MATELAAPCTDILEPHKHADALIRAVCTFAGSLSLFLFVRDIAGGDLIGWIDSQLEATTGSSDADLEAARQEALVGPLREVFGVADKVLTNALITVWLQVRVLPGSPLESIA
jgi:hypothetical protein